MGIAGHPVPVYVIRRASCYRFVTFRYVCMSNRKHESIRLVITYGYGIKMGPREKKSSKKYPLVGGGHMTMWDNTHHPRYITYLHMNQILASNRNTYVR